MSTKIEERVMTANGVSGKEKVGVPATFSFTAAYEPTEDGWWIGQILEVPGALTQGATLDEARENLKEALMLILECQRDETRGNLNGRDIIEEPIEIAVLSSI